MNAKVAKSPSTELRLVILEKALQLWGFKESLEQITYPDRLCRPPTFPKLSESELSLRTPLTETQIALLKKGMPSIIDKIFVRYQGAGLSKKKS